MKIKISREVLAEWFTVGHVTRHRVLEGVPPGAKVVQVIDDPWRDEVTIVFEVAGVVTDETISAVAETINFADVAEAESLISSTRYYVPKD